MAKVEFRAKGGKKVSFTSRARKAGKRSLTAYQRHVKKVIRGRKPGQSVQSAMRAAAKSWRG